MEMIEQGHLSLQLLSFTVRYKAATDGQIPYPIQNWPLDKSYCICFVVPKQVCQEINDPPV